MDETPFLVCFAVKEEAKYFLPPPGFDDPRLRLITGMGKKNATAAIQKALSTFRPKRLITAGFAGGLNPELKAGAVVFEEDADAGFSAMLRKAGAVPARFHCSDRVAATAAEKQALWKSTSADAVEMESDVIRAICHAQKIPAATVRVISDAADEDLPLDFNQLMTEDCRIDFARLAGKLITNPRKIPGLIQFQARIRLASRKLGEALRQSLLSDAG